MGFSKIVPSSVSLYSSSPSIRKCLRLEHANARIRAALVVPPDFDGLLRVEFAGLLHPAPTMGFVCVSKNQHHPKGFVNTSPRYGITPSEVFPPVAAVSHHCDHYPHAVPQAHSGELVARSPSLPLRPASRFCSTPGSVATITSFPMTRPDTSLGFVPLQGPPLIIVAAPPTPKRCRGVLNPPRRKHPSSLP
jgi:hypothetical protein